MASKNIKPTFEWPTKKAPSNIGDFVWVETNFWDVSAWKFIQNVQENPLLYGIQQKYASKSTPKLIGKTWDVNEWTWVKQQKQLQNAKSQKVETIKKVAPSIKNKEAIKVVEQKTKFTKDYFNNPTDEYNKELSNIKSFKIDNLDIFNTKSPLSSAISSTLWAKRYDAIRKFELWVKWYEVAFKWEKDTKLESIIKGWDVMWIGSFIWENLVRLTKWQEAFEAIQQEKEAKARLEEIWEYETNWKTELLASLPQTVATFWLGWAKLVSVWAKAAPEFVLKNPKSSIAIADSVLETMNYWVDKLDESLWWRSNYDIDQFAFNLATWVWFDYLTKANIDINMFKSKKDNSNLSALYDDYYSLTNDVDKIAAKQSILDYQLESWMKVWEIIEKVNENSNKDWIFSKIKNKVFWKKVSASDISQANLNVWVVSTPLSDKKIANAINQIDNEIDSAKKTWDKEKISKLQQAKAQIRANLFWEVDSEIADDAIEKATKWTITIKDIEPNDYELAQEYVQKNWWKIDSLFNNWKLLDDAIDYVRWIKSTLSQRDITDIKLDLIEDFDEFFSSRWFKWLWIKTKEDAIIFIEREIKWFNKRADDLKNNILKSVKEVDVDDSVEAKKLSVAKKWISEITNELKKAHNSTVKNALRIQRDKLIQEAKDMKANIINKQKAKELKISSYREKAMNELERQLADLTHLKKGKVSEIKMYFTKIAKWISSENDVIDFAYRLNKATYEQEYNLLERKIKQLTSEVYRKAHKWWNIDSWVILDMVSIANAFKKAAKWDISYLKSTHDYLLSLKKYWIDKKKWEFIKKSQSLFERGEKAVKEIEERYDDWIARLTSWDIVLEWKWYAKTSIITDLKNAILSFSWVSNRLEKAFWKDSIAYDEFVTKIYNAWNRWQWFAHNKWQEFINISARTWHMLRWKLKWLWLVDTEEVYSRYTIYKIANREWLEWRIINAKNIRINENWNLDGAGKQVDKEWIDNNNKIIKSLIDDWTLKEYDEFLDNLYRNEWNKLVNDALIRANTWKAIVSERNYYPMMTKWENELDDWLMSDLDSFTSKYIDNPNKSISRTELESSIVLDPEVTFNRYINNHMRYAFMNDDVSNAVNFLWVLTWSRKLRSWWPTERWMTLKELLSTDAIKWWKYISNDLASYISDYLKAVAWHTERSWNPSVHRVIKKAMMTASALLISSPKVIAIQASNLIFNISKLTTRPTAIMNLTTWENLNLILNYSSSFATRMDVFHSAKNIWQTWWKTKLRTQEFTTDRIEAFLTAILTPIRAADSITYSWVFAVHLDNELKKLWFSSWNLKFVKDSIWEDEFQKMMTRVETLTNRNMGTTMQVQSTHLQSRVMNQTTFLQKAPLAAMFDIIQPFLNSKDYTNADRVRTAIWYAAAVSYWMYVTDIWNDYQEHKDWRKEDEENFKYWLTTFMRNSQLVAPLSWAFNLYDVASSKTSKTKSIISKSIQWRTPFNEAKMDFARWVNELIPFKEFFPLARITQTRLQELDDRINIIDSTAKKLWIDVTELDALQFNKLMEKWLKQRELNREQLKSDKERVEKIEEVISWKLKWVKNINEAISLLTPEEKKLFWWKKSTLKKEILKSKHKEKISELKDEDIIFEWMSNEDLYEIELKPLLKEKWYSAMKSRYQELKSKWLLSKNAWKTIRKLIDKDNISN